MLRVIRLFHTSIGKKLVVALSGSVLVLFVLGHMLGNLSIYQGPNAINAYAAWLQGHPLLWGIRLVMLGIFVLHTLFTARLAYENRRARPAAYRLKTPVRSRFAERHMLFSGLLVLAFLVFHILHLTVGWIDAGHAALMDAQGRPDVYAKVIAGFQNPWISGIYLTALGLLGLHLHHAVQSIFQTLGFNHDSYQPLIVYGSIVLSLIIVLGLASIPIAVWAGVFQSA